MQAIKTPINTTCNAAARACSAWGTQPRNRFPALAQKVQTTKAPSTAPRLLPEPPTISIAHNWNVRMGRKSSGAMKPTKWA